VQLVRVDLGTSKIDFRLVVGETRTESPRGRRRSS
jgi:hypothetical protein